MPLVNVMVNGRAYTIACDEGEEEHLKQLAGHVDSKVRELLGSVGQVGDQRLMLMAALLMSDEYHTVSAQLDALKSELAELTNTREELDKRLDKSESFSADALETAAKRIENIAARLAHA
jgi:cell division protein ZapA